MLKYFFVFSLLFGALYAQPKGRRVTYGKLEAKSKECELELIQKSDKAIIEWESFSISEKEKLRFSQPSNSSAILNRVVGDDPSKIMGSLQANGKVYLLNENGILIGKTGTINTHSFIASTLKLIDDAFINDQELLFSGDSENSIKNLGKIEADKDIFLFSRKIENNGFIFAKKGTALLASGQLLLKEGEQERVFVCPNQVCSNQVSLEKEACSSDSQADIVNRGDIKAAHVEILATGGNIYSLAVNHEGLIDATCSENVKGRVILKATDGKTRVSGKILNKGQTEILGKNVHLDKDAWIDANALDKGGTVLIGGDYQGKNPKVLNASTTHIDPLAKIYANGIGLGDGGKVIVWGDKITSFYGHIEAKGGEKGGNGGFVEVSSPFSLKYKGFVETSAPNGFTGKLLLDPSNIFIGNTGSSPVYTSPSNPDFPNYNPTSGYASLNVADVNAALGGNDVELLTSAGVGGDGTVTVNGIVTWASTNRFTITADQNIFVGPSGAIINTNVDQTSDSVIVLQANADGSAVGDFIGVEIQGTVSSRGKSIQIMAEGGTDPANQYGVSINGGTVTSTYGSICIEGQGGGDGSSTNNYGVQIINSGVLSSTGLTGAAAIMMTARAGEGTNSNSGFYMNDPGSLFFTNGANINVTAIAGGTGSNNIGFEFLDGIIQTNTGAITLTGTGGGVAGSAIGNSGVLIDTPAFLGSSGAMDPGAITIVGSAPNGGTGCHGVIHKGTFLTDAADLSITGSSNATGDSSLGVLIQGVITTDSGDISLVGTGSKFAASSNIGANLSVATIKTKEGMITLMGTGGGDGSGTDNVGVEFSGASLLGATGPTGSIMITGIGGQGTMGNHGFNMISTSTIVAEGANIAITGIGKGSGSGNSGTVFSSTAANALSSASGAITIIGRGSTSGTSDNIGIDIDASDITSDSGAIILTGIGGGTTSGNNGVLIQPLSNITSASADISITGVGSINGTSENIGSSIEGQVLSTTGGAITVTGTGGGNGTSNNNIGISVEEGVVSCLGTPGTITLMGTGGNGVNGNYGVDITGSGATGTVSTDSSSIMITGIASGSGIGNSGIHLEDKAAVTSTTGNITLSGTATAADTGAGIEMIAPAFIETTTTGTITLTGKGSDSGVGTEGLYLSGASVIGAAGSTGDIRINADKVNIDQSGGAAIIQSSGEFRLYPCTLNTTIGLGDGATGTLNLNDNELDTLQDGFSSIIFGSPFSLGSVEMKGFTYLDPLIVNGKQITIATPVSAGANTAEFNVGTVGSGTFNLDAIVTAGTTTINGGASNDTVYINVSGQTAIVDGMGGSNTLVGPTGNNIWDIGPTDAGALNTTITFLSIQNLIGNSSDDTFNLTADGVGISGIVDGGVGGINLLDYSIGYTSPVTVDLGVPNATNIGTVLNINSFKASGDPADEIIAPNTNNTWNFSGVDTGTITSGATVIMFEDFANVTGGSKSDIFDLTSGDLTGLLDGGGGNNTLLGPTGPNTWNITDNNAGDVGSFDFVRIQNLTGNVLDDTFVLSDQKGISGLIDGGPTGTNTLDYSDYTTSVTVDLTADKATSVGSFVNLNTFIGGTGTDTIKGPNEDNIWTTTGPNAGTITNSSVQTFSKFENITGSSQDDYFLLGGGAISGIVNGGFGGTNTLDYSSFGAPTNVNLTTNTAPNTGGILFINNLIGAPFVNTLTGPLADSTWTFTGSDDGVINNAFPVTFTTFSNIIGSSGNDTFDFRVGTITGTLNGGGGSNLLLAPNTSNTWLITSDNAGTVIGVPFTNITDFGGGTNTDDFVFSDGVQLSGLDNGGLPTGINTLDYSAFTTPVEVIFLTETSGLASNLGLGFENIQNVIGNVNIRVIPTKSLIANVILSLRQLDRFIYTDQFIPIRYVNMYSLLNGVFTFYDVWEYIRHIQYLQKEKDKSTNP